MSDDIWRNNDEADSSAAGRRPGRYESSMDEFDSDEFGGPLFGDDSGGVSAPSPASAAGDVVTGSYTINFLRPAKGLALRAKGSVIKPGRRQVVVRADVWGENGEDAEHVATAQATIIPTGVKT